MLDKKKISILMQRLEEKDKEIKSLREELDRYKALESAMNKAKAAYEDCLAQVKQAKEECDKSNAMARMIVRDLRDITRR